MSKAKLYKCDPCVQLFVGRARYDEHMRFHKRSETKTDREARLSLSPPPKPEPVARKAQHGTPPLW